MLDPSRRLRSHKELQRDAIRRASTYAHFSQNPALYLNKAVGTPLSAYEWAVADYFGKPKVLDIDICRWTGEAGQTIRIQARDNLVVLRVNVKIWENSFLLEEGEAIESETEPVVWTYITHTAIQPKPGIWLDVVAYDLPGNTGQKFLVVK
jgi:hypothetical protein